MASFPPPLSAKPQTKPLRYSPYKFDPPPLIPLDATALASLLVDQFEEEQIKSEMASTSIADSVLLLAALETLGDSGEGGSDQGASSSRGQGDSLSPRSSRTTPPSAATDSSSGQGDSSYAAGEGDKPSNSYGYVSCTPSEFRLLKVCLLNTENLAVPILESIIGLFSSSLQLTATSPLFSTNSSISRLSFLELFPSSDKSLNLYSIQLPVFLLSSSQLVRIRSESNRVGFGCKSDWRRINNSPISRFTL